MRGRAASVVLLSALALGCVRETVSCTVLEPDDPLCQDPDADIDADVDGGPDAGEGDAGEGDAGELDASEGDAGLDAGR